jgi:hypothetical protein
MPLSWLASLLLFAALTACAARIVDHAFGFNAVQDSPGVEILDYRYGDSKQPTASNPEHLRKEGRSLQGTSIQGRMLRGDFLYVKWRIRSTGQVYEDTVDLRNRLPADIAHDTVYFIVKGPQLYVYLIKDELRDPDTPPIGSAVYAPLKAIAIYPTQPTSK